MDITQALPDHILTEIFGYLSPKLMKSCTLVCKRWAEIIGESRKFKQTFVLNLSENNIKADQVKRKYWSIAVENLTLDLMEIICQQNLHSLTIFGFVACSTLIKVLNNLPMLKVLHVVRNPFFDEHDENLFLEKAQIQLEELCCFSSFINIFECNTLKALSLLYEGVPNYGEMIMIAGFLKQQKNLKVLKLDGKYFSELFLIPEMLEVEFSLTKFQFFYMDDNFPHEEQLIKFLGLHKATLTRLEVDTSLDTYLIYEFALKNMPNLKHMFLGYFEACNFIIKLHELELTLEKVNNIESLKLCTTFFFHTNENNRFFEMFPNLKHLEVNDIEIINVLKILKEIYAPIINLESLSLCMLSFKDDITVYFPRIKNLRVEYVANIDDLRSFIKRHSKTLESFNFDGLHNLAESIIKETMHCDNLRLIEFTTNCGNVFSLMYDLKEIVTKIKRIKIVINCGRTHVFNFPDDKALWDERIADLELFYGEPGV